MPIITLIIGLFAGFCAGMIVAAGSWRQALGRLGAYATKASRTPIAPAAVTVQEAPKQV